METARGQQKAIEWAKTNTWFGADKQMTALALGFHNELVEDNGIDPASDEYYEKIDSRMREVFPDGFARPPCCTAVATVREASYAGERWSQMSRPGVWPVLAWHSRWQATNPCPPIFLRK